MSSLPVGTVTFLFTDIDGSTRLVQYLGDRWADVLAEHRRLLRTAVQDGHGHEVDTAGDGFFASFARARDAVTAAVAAQRALIAHTWPEYAAVRVRMGLHTGEPVRAEAGYAGLDVHRVARIAAAAHGQQILLSDASRALVQDELPPGIGLKDLGEHRLRDLARPQHLFQVIAADLPSEFPPLRSLDTLPNNLPRQLTSFIGREREMADLKRLLSTTVLLTLTGTGGLGKTRLALQVAADSLEALPDGAWLVELAPLADPALVPRTVASVFGIPEESARPVTDTLADFLRPRSLLLILDNCEHLLSACAQLADVLLHRCPNLKILATSREGLGIAGELTYRAPSLSLPDSRHLPPPETLAQYEAVRLFVERAAFGKPGFALIRDNAATVAQVCHRLDGIPLAIELAAARVKAMSVEDIANRLHDRFRLLTGGSRTAMPRQQTLRAALDWSYDLLSDAEQTVLRRLAAFEGGFTMEAAEAVCPGRDVGAADVLDLLTHLVDKSLVVAEDAPHGVRYRLLETVRQYSRDKLFESGEAADVRTRHRDFFLRLAEEAEPRLTTADELVWLERLEAEHDNMRTALGWSLEAGEAEAGLRLAGALGLFWGVRGYLGEGRDWLNRALAAACRASPAVRAKALLLAGVLAGGQSDYGPAAAILEESLALYKQMNDNSGIARSLASLGLMEFMTGNYERASALLESALSLFREQRDNWGTASTLRYLGSIADIQGSDQAAKLLDESFTLYRDIGNRRGIGLVLVHRGIAAYAQRDSKRALAPLEQSLALFREVGDRGGILVSQQFLGYVACLEGDHDRAMSLFRETIGLCRDLGNKRELAGCLDGLAEVATSVGHLERAVRLFGAAEALRRTTGVPERRLLRADRDRDVAAVRAAMGEDPFAASWAEGQAMTLDQAIAEALGDEGEVRERT